MSRSPPEQQQRLSLTQTLKMIYFFLIRVLVKSCEQSSLNATESHRAASFAGKVTTCGSRSNVVTSNIYRRSDFIYKNDQTTSLEAWPNKTERWRTSWTSIFKRNKHKIRVKRNKDAALSGKQSSFSSCLP